MKNAAVKLVKPVISAELPAAQIPDPEVVAKATRRGFSAKYKLQILAQVDHCAPGEIGALLRREGLYSSHLTKWKRQRDAGALQALGRARGRKVEIVGASAKHVAELERANARLQKKLHQAELLLDLQKKVSEILNLGDSRSPS